MTLREQVQKQLQFMGKTPGGCKLTLCNLLDHQRDVFQFMQLFDTRAIDECYYKYRSEIDTICSEDDALVAEAELTGDWERDHLKCALERMLMLIEKELKDDMARV